MIRVAILGSTGSIGKSALQVIARHPDHFQVVTLAANRRVEELWAQVERFGPQRAVLADESVPLPASSSPTRWTSGRQALLAAAADPEVDVVLNALVGATGLEPTLTALEAGHRLALANKESLVAGGPLVLQAAKMAGSQIVPIDSEHSAILQCLEGSRRDSVQRLVLTASGGPLRGRNREQLWHVRPEDALRHPTWDMGAKITIDSATLANKALEVIEACHLFHVPAEQVQVLVHRQSVIHSMVEFVDGSMLAQMGPPDMAFPILYALHYPERRPAPLQGFDPALFSTLTLEEIDPERYPALALGFEAVRRGGVAGAVLNAADEVAVEAFLAGDLRFLEITELCASVLRSIPEDFPAHTMDDVLAADTWARAQAREALSALQA